MSRLQVIVAISLLNLAVPTVSFASETITYSYDARGRLVTASRSGSVNNGVGTTYALDKEGNRTQVVVAGVGGGGGALVANADAGTYSTYDGCNGIGIAVTSNDSDPGGHYPLTVVSVSSSDPHFWVSSPYVWYTTGGWLSPGTYTATYTVENSVHAQATAQITLTFTGDLKNCD